jgi:hypothetical protein
MMNVNSIHDPSLHIPYFEDIRDYPLSDYLSKIGKKNLIHKEWKIGKILNQEASTCVGCACRAFLEAEPKPQKSPNEVEIFELAKKIENDPSKTGASLRCGIKALDQLGYIKNYYWAANITEIALALIHIGPVITGIHFYFVDIDTNREFLTATGAIAGEHCLLIYGVDFKKGYFLAQNSFDDSWGNKGTIKIDFATMEKILIYAIAPIKK